MFPFSNFTFTMLCAALILVLANAPLLPVYLALGIGAVWQLMVALVAAAEPPPPTYPVEISDEELE